MTKKEILKIPMLPRSADAPICVEAEVHNDTLIVDIHQGTEWIVRIVCLEEKWLNYDVKEKKWNQKKMLVDYNTKCNFFNEKGDQIQYPGKKVIEEYLGVSEKDYWYAKSDFGPLADISKWQDRILSKRSQKAYQTKVEKMNERVNQTEGYSEGFEKWALSEFEKRFPPYLYYENKGSRTTIHCGKCRKIFEGKINDETLEGQILNIKKPKFGEFGTCRHCRCVGIYKQYGRSRTSQTESMNVYDAIKMPGGLCIKYICITRRSYRDSEEKVWFEDIVRNFYVKNNHSKAFKYGDVWTKKEKWYPNNFRGRGAIIREDGLMSLEGIKKLKETYPYSCYDVLKEHERVSLIRYLASYVKYPQLEMLIKMGAYKLVSDIAWGINHNIDFKAKKVYKMFKIRQDRTKYFLERINDKKILHLLQFENRTSRISDENLKEIQELSWGYSTIESLEGISKHVKIDKACNYLKKINGISQHMLVTYKDYLNMRNQLGYDMTNSIILFPKNLEEEHAKMAMEINELKRNKRINECLEKFPNIAKSYNRLLGKLSYSAEGYLIRPAKDAGEIICEGAIQHHCVGGDAYLRKHDTGISYILLMRKIESPEIPFVTIEIKNNQIIQWYEAYDKKTHADIVQPWLDKYIERLNKKKRRSA